MSPSVSLAPLMAASDDESILEAVKVCNEGEDDDGDDPSSIESLPLDKEKQISVDPMSLKHPPSLLLPLRKPKFVSSSLPCSTASSPSALPKSFKKWIQPIQKSHPLGHQLSVSISQAMLLRRSKPCGEGRASQPSDEFDIMSRRPYNNSSLSQNGVHTIYDCSSKNPEVHSPRHKEKEFKCGALCLFLPAFSKKKQMQLQTSREEEDEQREEQREIEENRSVLSRVASLEKFECGSWSSAAFDGEDYQLGVNSYFDLPLELIRGGDGAHSPVRTAFVFEKDLKGVLKKSTSRSRKSHELSNRHVRFSTSTPLSYPSSPTSACITPRLLKAKEEFNALLEAQSGYINF